MEYVQLRSFDNYIEANIVMSMLQDAQVTCYLKDEHIVTIDPLLSPAIGGIKLMVHAEHVKRAWDLMDAAEEQYLKDIPCPVCKACALKAVSVTRKHTGKLSAVISMILSGQSVEIIKLYQCTDCGYDFKELPKER